MMLIKNLARLGVSAGLMVLLVFSSTAGAASACKGLASSQCSGKSDCVWVGGYTRKDNRKVSGYCRAKGTASNKTKTKDASSSRDSSSKSNDSSPQVKKKSSASKRTVTEKTSAKKSSGEKSQKKKTTTKKKSAEKSKSGSSKTKTKKKKKIDKAKTAN